ncbi:lysin, partial [Lactobacillus sp. XV13L]|nr:lysin [Lactobacillus sp. XV13L]
MTQTLKSRSYLTDVSMFQGNNVAYPYSKATIIKLCQYNYPSYNYARAKAQIASSKAHGLLTMGYFYATFSNNAARAKIEAEFACKKAKELGLPDGTYLAVDWESGSGNVITCGVLSSTTAILAAMAVIKGHGYIPLLYSGASAMRNNMNIRSIIRAYGNCLWVASYPTMAAVNTANMAYFPSIEGVAIWQFTPNYRGLNVDGNISVLPLKNGAGSTGGAKKEDDDMNVHPVAKWDIERVFVVTNKKGCGLYNSPDLKHKIKTLAKSSIYKVFDEKGGAIEVGKNQWVDGRAGFTKSNPIATHDNISGRVKIVLPNTHALYSPTANSKKAYKLTTNAIYRIVGRRGRFLELKDKYKG